MRGWFLLVLCATASRSQNSDPAPLSTYNFPPPPSPHESPPHPGLPPYDTALTLPDTAFIQMTSAEPRGEISTTMESATISTEVSPSATHLPPTSTNALATYTNLPNELTDTTIHSTTQQPFTNFTTTLSSESESTATHLPFNNLTTTLSSYTDSTATHLPLTNFTTTLSSNTYSPTTNLPFTNFTTTLSNDTDPTTTHLSFTNDTTTPSNYTDSTTTHLPFTNYTTTHPPFTNENTTRSDYTDSTTTHLPFTSDSTTLSSYPDSTTTHLPFTSNSITLSSYPDSTTTHLPFTSDSTTLSSYPDPTTTHLPFTSDSTTLSSYPDPTTTHLPFTNNSTTLSSDTDSTTTHLPFTNDATTHPPITDESTTRSDYTDSTTTHLPFTSDSSTLSSDTDSTTTHLPFTSDSTTLSSYTDSTTTHLPFTNNSTTLSSDTDSTTTHLPFTNDATTHPPITNESTTRSDYTDSTTTHLPFNNFTTTLSSDTDSTTTHLPFTSDSTTLSSYTESTTTHLPFTSDSTTLSSYLDSTTTHLPFTNYTTTHPPFTNESTTRSDYTDSTTTHLPITSDSTTLSSYPDSTTTHLPFTSNSITLSSYPDSTTTHLPFTSDSTTLSSYPDPTTTHLPFTSDSTTLSSYRDSTATHLPFTSDSITQSSCPYSTTTQLPFNNLTTTPSNYTDSTTTHMPFTIFNTTEHSHTTITTTHQPFTNFTTTQHSHTTIATTQLPTTNITTPPLNCENGGEVTGGSCVCPDEFTGRNCEIPNFCNTTKMGRFTFNKTAVGWFSYSNELCTSSEGSLGLPKATTQCTNDNGQPKFQREQTFKCGTSLNDLQQMINSTNASTIAISTQILTSKPETLTAENITMAAKITTTLLLAGFLEEAINYTVVTVSQLLKASRSEFSSQTSSVTESLTSALENFTLTGGAGHSEAVVQPNLAMQSLKVNVSHGAAQGIQFSAIPSTTQSFVSDRIYTTSVPQLTINKTTPTGVNIFIKFPQEITQEAMKVGFVLYQNDRFFQSRRFATPLGTTRNVITGSISSDSVGLRKTVPEFVELLYQPPPVRNATLYDFACVFWDYSLGDWSTEGCFKSNRLSESNLARGVVGCVCNHTTSFSMLLSFRKDVKYSKAMDIITFVGCFLSAIALSFTILLELIVSKSRKSNTTMILVSIYSSLLLFNLLFIFGANKPPVAGTVMADRSGNHMLKSDLHVDRDSGPCTAVTALMHFFLLATFTWNALYAMQMLLTNLRRTQLSFLKLSQPRFTVVSLLVGWGFPLVLTSFTLAVSYSAENPLNYRQQEFCWLATMDENGNFDPRRTLLWSFLLPVALVLFFNTVELVYFTITAVRQARRARRRSKSKTNNSCSLLKEVISSISLAVLLGLTWLIGYLLLVTHDPEVHTVLSIIFCVFNTTQGIQIFLLIPDWGRINTALRSMPTPTVSIGLHSKKYNVRAQHGRGLPEVYRKMETEFTSNFHILPRSSDLPREKET